MTTLVDIVNRALQAAGSRTTVTSLAEQSNEAFQSNLIIYALRDQLLRMAPWDCCNNTVVLQYITSIPGTPEFTGIGFNNWQKGLPAPPWAYEYQYPADCLRALSIIPAYNTGTFSGFPQTTGITTIPSLGGGGPARFKVSIDQFYQAIGLTIASPGNNYQVGDIIVLQPGSYSINNIPTASPPIGAPALVLVTATSNVPLPGSITAATLIPSISQAQPENTSQGSGAYFLPQLTPQSQGSLITTNPSPQTGNSASFNLTFGPQGDQRVILANQEFALLCYNKQVTSPDLMDPLFIEAWVAILAARLVFQLTGDKILANLKIGEANSIIMEARKADGNEGLTINDVTPDWIRTRGIVPIGANWEYSPNVGVEWGNTFGVY